MIEIKNKSEFDTFIKDNTKVVADFYANWCGPCRMLGPVLKDISEEMSDVKFIKINVDNNNVLCQEYSVFSIPAVFIFNGGVKKDSFNGFMPKDEVIKKITAAVE